MAFSLAAAFGAAPALATPSSIAAQLAAAHLPEPLVATGTTTPAEDLALLHAVEAWDTRTNSDDFSSLDGFLASHPQSAWRVAVLTNLGIVYRHYGYFSRALEVWHSAWKEGRGATGPRPRALVDRAVGELVQLEAELGKKDDLAATLKEIGMRPVGGPGTALVEFGRETLWVMNTDPKHLYNCGPMALKTLLLAQHASPQQVFFLNWVKADGPKGTNLAQVVALAKKAHADLVPVFRKAGEKVPVPSIVHWKVDHFAAIVGEANGRYHVEDPTFGRQGLWVTPAALDAEASGYFLVPEKLAQAAPWRQVAAAEAGGVWGAGDTTKKSGNPDNSGCGCGGGNGGPPGCVCRYGINEQNVSLFVTDKPVGYTPPKGPSAQVLLAYAQLDQNQPANFDFFNVSQKWTINWLSFVEDDPTAPGTNVTRYLRNGALYRYTGFDRGNHRFAAQEDDASLLEKTGTASYRRFLQDGSVETYAETDGSTVFPRRIFLSRITDPQGNALTVDYDKSGGRVRLVSLTDATGRKTNFSYGSRVSPLLITRITDPFGRSAELTYDGSGRLSTITDVIGLTSKLSYDATSQINALTTPYGITRFSYGTFADVNGPHTGRFLNVVDPLGYGEREEAFQPAVGVPSSEPASQVPQLPRGVYAPYFNAYLEYRDSFHWNKHQYALAGCTPNGGCDYRDARITHFTHDAADTNTEWDTVESVKEPLENRVWYTYPGQPLSGGLGAGQSGAYDRPNSIARVLDDGQTQVRQVGYNAAGNPTTYVDPVGRTTDQVYAANQIDIAAVEQVTGGGKETIARYTYNSEHRPLSYTDAAGKTTHYTYNGAGQLASETNPLGQTTRYEYNATGDLLRVIDADGKTAASYTYNAFDEVASYTDSEGWKVDYDYDAAGRLTRATYLDGTTDLYTYDKLDLSSYKDRQGKVWRYAHDADQRLTAVIDPLGHVTRYAYYEDGTLKSLTDPDGHRTSWAVDVESRPVAKIYADGTGTAYQYEFTTSRLKAVTDALGQTAIYTYALDDWLSTDDYVDALHQTPNVSFAYDPYFPRLIGMTDGTGTTTYSYVPGGKPGALQLAQEKGPLPNDTITYAYDALGRMIGREVGGAGAETFQFDKIGRLVGHSDALGKFTTTYLGETEQPTRRQLVGGNVATAWSYLSNTEDRRLKSIVNTPGREFDYTTTPEYLVTAVGEKRSGKLIQSWSFAYDNVYRLLTGTSSRGARYGYTLDPTDNILSFKTPGGTKSAAYNKLNELTALAGKPFVYDADGELINDGVHTYTWDAEGRLVGVTQAGTHTSFAYDGLDRRIMAATTKSGKTTTTDYIWCGARICQSRNGRTEIGRLYYDEGEVIPGSRALLYYGTDLLGSVRDVYAKSPVFSMVEEYDYDPYGNPTAMPKTGPLTDFRYAGLLYDADSSFYLTQFRAFNPAIGRWLSRDPIEEEAGPNLYAYVRDDPVGFADISGLDGNNVAIPAFGKGCYDGLQNQPGHRQATSHMNDRGRKQRNGRGYPVYRTGNRSSPYPKGKTTGRTGSQNPNAGNGRGNTTGTTGTQGGTQGRYGGGNTTGTTGTQGGYGRGDTTGTTGTQNPSASH